jgi:hypothetical protein
MEERWRKGGGKGSDDVEDSLVVGMGLGNGVSGNVWEEAKKPFEEGMAWSRL